MVERWVNPFEVREKKKRKAITPALKTKLWLAKPHHVCHVCYKLIPSLDAAELDHVRAFAKGGKSVRWACRSCNRLKGKLGLAEAQKIMGVYRRKKRKVKKKPKQSDSLWKRLKEAGYG